MLAAQERRHRLPQRESRLQDAPRCRAQPVYRALDRRHRQQRGPHEVHVRRDAVPHVQPRPGTLGDESRPKVDEVGADEAAVDPDPCRGFQGRGVRLPAWPPDRERYERQCLGEALGEDLARSRAGNCGISQRPMGQARFFWFLCGLGDERHEEECRRRPQGGDPEGEVRREEFASSAREEDAAREGGVSSSRSTVASNAPGPVPHLFVGRQVHVMCLRFDHGTGPGFVQ
mmetsp:Transcript_34186/g.88329  ORF Transcript_34186/g.88329 Transcript_34186/m.88329 type:complete len:230 (+) Transcript_34186:692-1381(+)